MPPDVDMTPGDNTVINAAMMNQDSHVYRLLCFCNVVNKVIPGFMSLTSGSVL